MKTTAIFVELLIVGVMTILLLMLAITVAAGTQWWLALESFVKDANLLKAILVLALTYVVGIIADESYDALTNPLESLIIKRVLKDKSERAWELQRRAMLNSSEAATGVEYMRGRIRIVRATVVITPLATVLGLAAALLRGPIPGLTKLGSATFVFILGCLLSAGSYFAYQHLTDNYWHRIEEFAQEEQEEGA